MACRRPVDKPLSEPMIVNLLTYIFPPLGLNELIPANYERDAPQTRIVSLIRSVTTGMTEGQA